MRKEKSENAMIAKTIVNNNITWHNKTLQNELDTFYIKGQNWWYRTSFHISYIFIFIPPTTTTAQNKNAMKILKIKPMLLVFVCRNLTYVHQIDIYFLLQTRTIFGIVSLKNNAMKLSFPSAASSSLECVFYVFDKILNVYSG